jgi:hypothetical protein
MNKNIDLKNRVVDMYNVDTGQYESEIISYLDRKMKVRFHSAIFNNSRYVFTGNPKDKSNNAITVSGYRKKNFGENISIDIGPNY